MLTLTTALATHIAGDDTALKACWKVTLKNGTVKRFTDHDQDITLTADGTYLAAAGFDPSAIQTSSDLSVDNLSLIGIAIDPSMVEPDIIAGLWDNARVEIKLINWADPDSGFIKQKKGWLGPIKTDGNKSEAEVLGLWQALAQQVVVEMTSPMCRADFGDARCKIDLAAHTFDGTVTTVTSAQRAWTDTSLSGETAGRFEQGKVTWVTGLNAGLEKEVMTHTAGATITLMEPMPYEIQVGDTYTVSRGCKKRFEEDCIALYNNAINFRGEPHAAGRRDAMAGP